MRLYCCIETPSETTGDFPTPSAQTSNDAPAANVNQAETYPLPFIVPKELRSCLPSNERHHKVCMTVLCGCHVTLL